MNETINITSVFFKLINFELPKKHITKFYNENSLPDSFLFFVELLKSLYIKTLALKANFENIDDLPYPVIVQFNDGKFGIIKAKENNYFIVESQNKERKYLKEELFSIWNGKSIICELTEESQNKRLEILAANKKIPIEQILIAGGAFLFFIIKSLSYNLKYEYFASFYLLFSLKIVGIVMSIILALKSTNNNSSSFLCKIGKIIDCNAVLNSKGANFFGFSWSEIGFYYFSGSLFLILIHSNPVSFVYLSYFSFLSLFYILYSVFYQAFIVKKWCLFCLVIVNK